jgi:hypothetical protein
MQRFKLLQHLLNDDESGRNVKVIWFSSRTAIIRWMPLRASTFEAKLSTKEFRMAANKRCGMSRAMFYRLLKKGRKELRFRQRDGTNGLWEAV